MYNQLWEPGTEIKDEVCPVRCCRLVKVSARVFTCLLLVWHAEATWRLADGFSPPLTEPTPPAHGLTLLPSLLRLPELWR
ncbi:hypothetical protein CesoFtcFv8_018295 [Champsocephalus esox]|uniref:Uncharacterized protein n=1 Tax=Champsocephalus esox TaxID=159716 RepID=A0AAN8BFV5_9TELE|nr:hypothetical protein CesoFtcFv8_018295 [Champsocephalus esox]